MRKLVESKPRSDVHSRARREAGRPKMAKIIEAFAAGCRSFARDIREANGVVARMLAACVGWYEELHRLRSIAAALRCVCRAPEE